MEMTRTTWKKLIQDSDTVSYEKNLGDYRIIIEARNTDAGWDIIKKYVGGGINFAETYTAKSTGELKNLLKHLRAEKDLSKNEIQDINAFRRKDVRVQIQRAYKTDDVEKWNFCITDSYANYVTIYYGRELTIDIVMEQRFKYIEENIIQKLYEVLAIDNNEQAIQQNIYYFSKKSSNYTEAEDDVDVEFIFE